MRVLALSTAACLALSLAGLSTTASAAPPGTVESAVTDDGAYVRHDGGTDRAIQHCSTGGSSAPPAAPATAGWGRQRTPGARPARAPVPRRRHHSRGTGMSGPSRTASERTRAATPMTSPNTSAERVVGRSHQR